MIQNYILETKGDDYRVWHDLEANTTYMQGLLRLSGKAEYQPIASLLQEALEQSSQFTLDVRELEFLNSSGITMLTMFVVKARQKGNVALTVKGSEKILWQTKSLKNLQRLMPHLNLEFTQ